MKTSSALLSRRLLLYEGYFSFYKIVGKMIVILFQTLARRKIFLSLYVGA